MRMKDKKIGVLMGGFGSEREVSFSSGEAVLDSLKESGYDAVKIDVQEDLVEKLRQEHIEAAFVALHGPVGEDGIVQGVLEFLRIPYTGSGVLASALAMDKRIAKRIFRARGIPTAEWEELRHSENNRPQKISPPMVIKPSRQGSTVGISIIMKDEPGAVDKALEEAFALDEWVLAEERSEERRVGKECRSRWSPYH